MQDALKATREDENPNISAISQRFGVDRISLSRRIEGKVANVVQEGSLT